MPWSYQVVANAVAALAEIGETSQSATTLSDLDTPTINKLLTALNECTEWGQVFILDSIAVYTPSDEREAQRYRVHWMGWVVTSCYVCSCVFVVCANVSPHGCPMPMQQWSCLQSKSS